MIRCSVPGCRRRADTLVEGEDIRTGAALPSVYVCDIAEHQHIAALSILPADCPAPDGLEAAGIVKLLRAWNKAYREDTE